MGAGALRRDVKGTGNAGTFYVLAYAPPRGTVIVIK